MAAGDFFNNMWLMVKSYAFPHTPHLKTVSELQTLVTKILTYSESASLAYDQEPDIMDHCTECQDRLREYCANNEEAILEIFPSLEKPLSDFNAPNPFYDNIFDGLMNTWTREDIAKFNRWNEFGEKQVWTFVRELEAALYFD